MDYESLKTVIMYSTLASFAGVTLFMLIIRKIMLARYAKGKMSGEQFIEFTAGLVLRQMRKEGKKCSFTIDGLRAIDAEIDSLLAKNKPADIVSDTDTVVKFGCFLGTVLKYAAGARWVKDEGPYPRFMKLKNGEMILPFERVMKRILAGKEDCIYDYAYVLKKTK